MKKVVLNLSVTLDGFIEGPNKETDWCIMDREMDFGAFLDSVDTIFYGRVSYEAWGNFQPDSTASTEDKALWRTIHAKNKYVFSQKDKPSEKDIFITSDIAKKVAAIKQGDGKDIWLYGGAGLTNTFIQLGLIDVYKISVHPVILGQGMPLFENLHNRISLKLTDTRVFHSGVVELTYEPLNEPLNQT
ncbi:dihydrofolate reductase family protein [Arachidicoccus ginsenosidivorans]|uniref:Dihydrofolate reductase n=1 Tax=Arachidicoccus ginsenosidivorans TaxID=496057 RepID=A0A5B8VPV6_9BACT|nr:dihydrofolate reductase family protein [Arachidicoccus ginsenosidivorans]QEC72625.1 dihydrofolate reductase [Arachidicoccus ginsenosidivorans]